MFEKLYKRPATLARHQKGPLAKERRAFLRRLADEGMTRGNLLIAASYLLIIARRLGLASREGEMIGLPEIKKESACWARRQTGRFKKGKRSDRARQRFTGFAIRWLSFLDRFQRPEIPTTPFDAWIDAFSDHMRQERGFTEHTIRGHCTNVRDFLCRLNLAPNEFTHATVAQVEGALTTKLEEAGWARSTVQDYVGALRGFFRLGERMGWCPRGIADAIESPRIYREATIPTGPSWEEVCRLIASVDGDRPMEIRDRAIVLLLAVYGLRAGEVVSLKLDSLDWQDELLTVMRGKNGKTQIFPLCRTVGDALLRYLREVRPRSPHRELFFQYVRPLPLSRGGLTRIVQKRLRAVDISVERLGAHSLRHACATRLIEQGLTLKEIGDHLGHQSLDSTRIYAKVNLTQLRIVADLDLGGLA